MDEIHQPGFDGKHWRVDTLAKLVFVEHLGSFILIPKMQLFLKWVVNNVCNLYNNHNNIQKHLTFILLQSHWPFLLPLLLWLCPPFLIILTSHLGFLLLPLHLSVELPQIMGSCLHTSDVGDLICLETFSSNLCTVNLQIYFCVLVLSCHLVPRFWFVFSLW